MFGFSAFSEQPFSAVDDAVSEVTLTGVGSTAADGSVSAGGKGNITIAGVGSTASNGSLSAGSRFGLQSVMLEASSTFVIRPVCVRLIVFPTCLY